MYRINNCYCKLKKRIEELEKEVNQNYSGDSNLSDRIQELKNALDENSARDEELQNKVSSLETGDNVTPSTQGAIDDLFNG